MYTGIWNSFNEKFHVHICTSQSNKSNFKKKKRECLSYILECNENSAKFSSKIEMLWPAMWMH